MQENNVEFKVCSKLFFGILDEYFSNDLLKVKLKDNIELTISKKMITKRKLNKRQLSKYERISKLYRKKQI